MSVNSVVEVFVKRMLDVSSNLIYLRCQWFGACTNNDYIKRSGFVNLLLGVDTRPTSLLNLAYDQSLIASYQKHINSKKKK